ncbi:AaceriAFR456Cp [[Ashbya] aceris (nom. inval.)]|nr:AaceriAFR456Cp [[Ashbya] aceris (nom. inval.)]
MSLFVTDESDEELQQELSIMGDQRAPGPSTEEQGEGAQEEAEDELYPLMAKEDSRERPNFGDIQPVDIQLSVALPFQQIIVENTLISEDCLLIMARGLGTVPVVSNLLHVLATPVRIKNSDKRSLVLLLNASDDDNRRMEDELMELSWLAADATDRPFVVINSDSHSIAQRTEVYSGGGIISVTSRILIVDMLSGIIHPNVVTGLFIMHADLLTNYSTESFIVDIYREHNRWGFIKAVTESPESLVTDFSPLLRKMKDLKLQRILLWPRFHADVSSSLHAQKNNTVVEIKVSLTDSMEKIHYGLLECLKKCINELVRKVPELAKESWSIENALDAHFMKSIHAELQPRWHRISYESKQLVKDISTLRKLLHALLSYDAVDFYELIRVILDANKPSISRKYSESPWLLAAESQLVISYSKKRVYHDDEYLLEEQPKWEQLVSLLDDISYERLAKPTTYTGPTVIICSDERTRQQLGRILSYYNSKEGNRKMMIRKLQSYIRHREQMQSTAKEIQEQHESRELQVSKAFAKEEVSSKRRRTRGASAVAAVTKLHTATGTGHDIDAKISIEALEEERERLVDPDDVLYTFESFPDVDINAEEYDLYAEPYFNEPAPSTTRVDWQERTGSYEYVHPSEQVYLACYYHKDTESLLYELLPSFVIMYEPNLSFIRQVEVYRATHTNKLIKIYFMYYGESVEEQAHLLNIKKEREAFTKLIRENARLAQHFEAPEDISRYKNLAQRRMQLLRQKNTRIAGGQSAMAAQTDDIVIVDIREFRAPLPGLLYRYGVKVLPCMLTVGDYIITPKICIERKSIADLIGSFKNGRLQKQCRAMAKYYDLPTLLLEFDDNESFSLEPFGERGYTTTTSSTIHPISNKLMQEEIQLELAKLVLRFPNLKIIWSSSPLQTVNIILDLKSGREQPNPSVAVEAGKSVKKTDSSGNPRSTIENKQFHELSTVPGLSSIDYYNLKRRYRTYKALQRATVDDILHVVVDRDLAERIVAHIQRESELQQYEDDAKNDV